MHAFVSVMTESMLWRMVDGNKNHSASSAACVCVCVCVCVFVTKWKPRGQPIEWPTEHGVRVPPGTAISIFW